MSDATKILSNQPEVVEPVMAAPVVAEPAVVAETPVVVDPLWAEPAIVEPGLVADPVWADSVANTVVVDEVVAPAVVPPPVVAPVVSAPVVEPVVAVAPVTTHAIRRSYAASFAPDAMVAAGVGLVILLFGLLAITRGGFDGPMHLPVVSVMGFTHTTTLGLLEVIIGGCLLISGATRSRSAALFFGSVLGIGAFVGAVQTESFRRSLALESGFAWLLVLGGVAVVLSALLLPRYVQRSTVVYPA